MQAAQEGVPLATIDRAAEAFGMPMGPIELADTVGLDVCLHVGRILAAAFGRVAPESLAPLVEAGKLGRKSGEGLYVWKDGKAVKPAADASTIPEDLVDRLMLPMVNEGIAILRERVVADADLVDAGVIFGSGFAPFRGGPLRYARERGIANVLEQLRQLESRYGARFRADAGWADFGAETV
jgi:3-hydroxyacyl-CoA dehydrogenase/enoyl-CoA hydratase/3-hydroxybutyryl-CoA epimerase